MDHPVCKTDCSESSRPFSCLVQGYKQAVKLTKRDSGLTRGSDRKGSCGVLGVGEGRNVLSQRGTSVGLCGGPGSVLGLSSALSRAHPFPGQQCPLFADEGAGILNGRMRSGLPGGQCVTGNLCVLPSPGAPSEDPQFPKVQWPPRELCSACHSELQGAPVWDLGNTLKFLKTHFSPSNVVLDLPSAGLGPRRGA